MSYCIKKDKEPREILYMEYDVETYTFIPNNKKNSRMSIKSISIYDPYMINNLISKKCRKNFERLFEIIVRYLNEEEDPDSGDCMLLLDDVERLRISLELDYKKYLHNKEYLEYIHNLAYLDNQVRQKLAAINYEESLRYSEVRNRMR